MTLALLGAALWLLCGSLLSFLPCTKRRWRAAFALVLAAIPLSGWITACAGPLWGLVSLCIGALVLRRPLRVLWRGWRG